MGLYPQSVQKEVYGSDPDVRIAGIFESQADAKRADGGVVIGGRWPFASGCHHSDWAMLGFPIKDDSGNPVDQGLALVPMRELGVEPTWNVAGMSGTGSDTLTGSDIFVPNERVIAFSEAARGFYIGRTPGHIYRAPFVPAAVLAVLPPILGLARGALDVTLERLHKGKRVAYTFYDDARKAPATQMNIARAATLIDTAFLHAHRSAAVVDRSAETGEDIDFVSRARLRMDCGYAAQCCRDAVEILLSIQGASSFALSNPLQRIWRDLETASRHGLLDAGTCQEIYGRALLGIEDRTTMLI
jgi:3-hydroxy-9,10-secoandrosta-1,3,5(10)-triene-9,17-dione monooxygenase